MKIFYIVGPKINEVVTTTLACIKSRRMTFRFIKFSSNIQVVILSMTILKLDSIATFETTEISFKQS